MDLVDSVKSTVNYTVTCLMRGATSVATTPPAVDKVLRLAPAVFALFDLHYFGKIQARQVTDAMQGSLELLEFYTTFTDIMFFIYPFSKESLDREALEKSCAAALCATIPQGNLPKNHKEMAVELIDEVISGTAFYSATEVREILAEKIKTHGIVQQDAEEIAAKSTIQQQTRPLTLLFSTACFTIVDLAGNITTLNRWGIINLSAAAAQIGAQSRVFLFVVNLGAGTALGTIACAALIVTFSEASSRAVRNAIKNYHTEDPEDRQQAYQELREALLDMLSSSADLLETAAPLLFTLNPPVIASLAIFAKVTGLTCMFIK